MRSVDVIRPFADQPRSMPTTARRGRTTRAPKASLGLVCFAALLIAGGCRQPEAPAPLRSRPVTQLPPETEWIVNHTKELEKLTPEAREALEREWLRGSGDLRAAEQLLLLKSRTVQTESAAERERRVRILRQVILWLIEHHPDHFVHNAYFATLSGQTGDTRRDRDGYRAAALAWQRQVARPDATAAALGNAASFFRRGDSQRTEALLIRARDVDPDDGKWSSALGLLYAAALYPSSPGMVTQRASNADVAPVNVVPAGHARERLATTRDSRLLSAAGRALTYNPEHRAAAVEYLTRARTLDPNNLDAKRALDSIEFSDWSRRLNALLSGKPRDSWPDVVSSLPPAEQLRATAELASGEYMYAEYNDWGARHPRTDEERRPEIIEQRRTNARDGWRRSRAWAHRALELAETHRNTPSYPDPFFYSHITLGLNALRDGDHAAARRHLDLASTTPAFTSTGSVRSVRSYALEDRFITWLLKDGERQTVIAYFERLAASHPDARARLQRAADDIRQGLQPLDYFLHTSIYGNAS